MLHILFISHGEFANGLLSSLKFFSPNKANVTAICAYTGESDVEGTVKKYFESIPEEDSIIAMSDIAGGSVNQLLMRYLGRKNFHLITGTNVPVLLEVATLSEDEDIAPEEIRRIIEYTRTSIKYVNEDFHAEFTADDE